MTAGYATTTSLLGTGKVDEATKRYSKECVSTIKELYAKAGTTYPVRFAKHKDWCTWTRRAFVLARNAETALQGKKVEEATTSLAALREHYHQLHTGAQLLTSNDLIYAFWSEVAKPGPDPKVLNTLRRDIPKADLSIQAKARKSAYTAALTRWQDVARPILRDGTLAEGELGPLRTATDTFRNAFGMSFE